MKKKSLIIDIEANGLEVWKVETIWCIVCQDIDTEEIFTFSPKESTGDKGVQRQFKDDFVKFISKYDHFIGHNFLGYDAWVCNFLLGTDFGPHNVTDTTVLSRLFRPTSPAVELFGLFKKNGWDNRGGGHSLGAWGNRLGIAKGDFDEFEYYTPEMLEYCIQDVKVNLEIYRNLMKEKSEFNIPQASIDLEHEAHWLLTEQKVNGFTLHKERARKLYKETSELIEEYENELYEIFPPKKKLVEVYKPRIKKDGTLGDVQKKKLAKFMHEEGDEPGTYNLYVMEEFNPASPAQVGERLKDLNWNPRKFTPTGQPSVSKDVIGDAIEELSSTYPQVEVLRKYNIVLHRNSLVKEWLELAESDDKIHGSCFHIGPWTHRSSHREPNMGNVPGVQLGEDKKPIKGLEGNFGWDCRHCLVASPGNVLVGVDASGIQLRALAHYMNDEDYIKEVCEGDVHVKNQTAAGIHDRPTAKTFIYAWLLGAGDEKIGAITTPKTIEENFYDEILKEANSIKKFNPFISRKKKSGHTLFWYVVNKLRKERRPVDKDIVAKICKGSMTKKKFLDALPSLRRFKEVDIELAAEEGFMVGLDGRKIWVPNAHFAMGAYLQGFESVIMKKAMSIFHKRLKEEGYFFKQVAYVHDEWVIETKPEIAEKVKDIVEWSIPEAGRQLGSLCPLASEGRIGESWAVVH